MLDLHNTRELETCDRRGVSILTEPRCCASCWHCASYRGEDAWSQRLPWRMTSPLVQAVSAVRHALTLSEAALDMGYMLHHRRQWHSRYYCRRNVVRKNFEFGMLQRGDVSYEYFMRHDINGTIFR